MKRYITLISLLLIVTFSLFGGNNSETLQTDKILVRANIVNKGSMSNMSRSVSHYTIEVYVYPDLREVEVSLYNIGTAEVDLYNSYGQLVSYDCVDTDIPVTVDLDPMSDHGTFYIIIDSELYYAQGCFSY